MIETLLAYPLAAAESLNTDLWGVFYETTQTIVDEKLGVLASIAVTVAAIVAAFNLFHTAVDWSKGGDHGIIQIAAPLAILVVVMNFTFVSGLFDTVVNVFCREIAASAGSGIGDMMSEVDDAFKAAGGATSQDWSNDVANAGGDGWAERLFNKVKGAFEFATRSFYKFENLLTFTLITFVCRFIIDLMFLVFQVIAAMYLTILRLIGPFALAFAVNDKWRDGLRSWCERYIETSLWMPIGYIVIGIMTGIYGAIATLLATGGLEEGAIFIGLAMIFASFRAIKSIPEIAGWIISGHAHGLQNANPLTIAGYAKMTAKGDVAGMVEKMSR